MPRGRKIRAVEYLRLGLYERALSAAKESSDSRDMGAGALAAHHLAGRTKDLEEEKELILDEVELAMACEEKIPRAQASFDAMGLGMRFSGRDMPDKSWILFLESIRLGYTCLPDPKAVDGLELSASCLGWEAYKDDDAEEPDHELIQNEIATWMKHRGDGSVRDVLRKFTGSA